MFIEYIATRIPFNQLTKEIYAIYCHCHCHSPSPISQFPEHNPLLIAIWTSNSVFDQSRQIPFPSQNVQPTNKRNLFNSPPPVPKSLNIPNSQCNSTVDAVRTPNSIFQLATSNPLPLVELRPQHLFIVFRGLRFFAGPSLSGFPSISTSSSSLALPLRFVAAGACGGDEGGVGSE